MENIEYVISTISIKKDENINLGLHWNEFYDDFKKIWREEFPHLRLPNKKKIADMLCSHFETQICSGFISKVRRRFEGEDMLILHLDEDIFT
jgi:hypothetical protein